MPMPKRSSMKSQNVNDEDEEEAPQKGHGMQQQQPPRSISKNVRGQIRDYYYLNTVKSFEDLDKLRFKVINNGSKISK
jgi:hypothetical protein